MDETADHGFSHDRGGSPIRQPIASRGLALLSHARSGSRGQPVEKPYIAVDLGLRTENESTCPSRRAESRAELTILEEPLGLGGQLRGVREEEAGDTVFDERAVAFDVRGEHRASESERLE